MTARFRGALCCTMSSAMRFTRLMRRATAVRNCLWILVGVVLLLPSAVFAQPTSIIKDIPNCNFTDGRVHKECVPAFLSHLIQFIFGLAGAACLIMIIWAGYEISLAKALGKDRSEGLTRLKVAITGFILCAMSWYIIDFIIAALAGT